MIFQIQSLSADNFADLFKLDDDQLAKRGIVKVTADSNPGYPCRVSLQDAPIGDSVILLNYDHLPVRSPYASKHAIFVSESGTRAELAPGEIPEVIKSRLVSVRGFDGSDMMQDADIVEGDGAAQRLERMFADPEIRYVDIHFAKRGCFAARAIRVGDAG